jgi:hypothetical protein
LNKKGKIYARRRSAGIPNAHSDVMTIYESFVQKNTDVYDNSPGLGQRDVFYTGKKDEKGTGEGVIGICFIFMVGLKLRI